MPNINGNSKITSDFGDAARLRLIAAVQRSSIESMSLRPGFCVLDVGCGRGSGTLALAAAVGATGAVRGVDYDAMQIAEARQRALRDGVDSRVSYHQANAIALPWPDGYFNASRSDRVLQHMLEPVRAFVELLRVTRTGGRVVVIDGDWATLNIDSDDPNVEARLAHFQETLRPRNLRSGQCLRGLFKCYGLRDVTLDVRPAFESDADPAWCWQQSRSSTAYEDGRYASANVVIISGRKS